MEITVKLSASGLADAIAEVEQYANDLKRKTQILVDRLAKLGIEVIDQQMAIVPSEEKGYYYTEVMANSQGDMIGAAIHLSGNKVLFIEFSAGITFGTSSYPTAGGSGYGMGTYNPESSNWSNPHGWWYTDEGGNKKHSYGNRAYMPMYHAEQGIILQVSAIAAEVFG